MPRLLAQLKMQLYICNNNFSDSLMKARSFLLLTTAAIGTLLSTEAMAQTCRITSGVNANGSLTFKEVYEFDFVEDKPEFPGGGTALINYINDTRRYPAEAYARGIEGRVTCSFVVNTDGKVSDIAVLRGVEHSLNREAIRIISKMPSWSPGKLDGQAVPVRVICAVPFRK